MILYWHYIFYNTLEAYFSSYFIRFLFHTYCLQLPYHAKYYMSSLKNSFSFNRISAGRCRYTVNQQISAMLSFIFNLYFTKNTKNWSLTFQTTTNNPLTAAILFVWRHDFGSLGCIRDGSVTCNISAINL